MYTELNHISPAPWLFLHVIVMISDLLPDPQPILLFYALFSLVT